MDHRRGGDGHFHYRYTEMKLSWACLLVARQGMTAKGFVRPMDIA
ncbi:hypothetical protein EV128_11994 [Rhizobium azibense]|nr:hypothetical protein EV128_11994 [Rhizobium azibense]